MNALRAVSRSSSSQSIYRHDLGRRGQGHGGFGVGLRVQASPLACNRSTASRPVMIGIPWKLPIGKRSRLSKTFNPAYPMGADFFELKSVSGRRVTYYYGQDVDTVDLKLLRSAANQRSIDAR